MPKNKLTLSIVSADVSGLVGHISRRWSRSTFITVLPFQWKANTIKCYTISETRHKGDNK